MGRNGLVWDGLKEVEGGASWLASVVLCETFMRTEGPMRTHIGRDVRWRTPLFNLSQRLVIGRQVVTKQTPAGTTQEPLSGQIG